MSGAITLNATLAVDGAGDTVLGGPISSGSDAWQPGLLEGRFTGGTTGTTTLFDETFVNTGTGGAKLTPAAGEIASTPPWSDYTGYVYTGQFYDSDGVFTFAENVDDMVEVKVDGVARLRNTAATTPSTTGYVGLNSDNPFGAVNTSVNYGMGPLGDGWHDIEIRFYNATGGAGAVGNNYWSSLKGFGIDRNTINTSILGNAYLIPADPGDMSLVRTRISSGNALTKTGSGTLTLGGDNTYSGPTNIEEGRLLVDGSTGTGAVDIQTGTILGGTGGVIKGILTIAAGASLEPGASAGRLTMNADTSFTSGSTFRVDLDGTTAATQHDQIVQNGQIHLNGATLELNVGYTPAAADRYVVIDNDGAEPIDGTFAGLVNHAVVNLDGYEFRIFYDGGDGNDIVLVKTAPLAVSTIRYDVGAGETSIDVQRSVISRIVVTFNGLVDSMDPTGALTVDRVLTLSDLRLVNVEYSQDLVGENTQVTLVFTGGEAYVSSYERPTGSGQFSLNDGNYRLTVDKDVIHSGAGDMTEDEVDNFYRWFGDSDGDRDTDGSDMFNIRRVVAGDPAFEQYTPAFDHDGDGEVYGTDYSSYFEYVENSILAPSGAGSRATLRPDGNYPFAASPRAINSETGTDDLTVADNDDILMFTTRSPNRPFVGRFGPPSGARNTIESQVAEVAWFVRGRTLYRRLLLVVPGVTLPVGSQRYYANYDVSVHAEPTRSGYRLVPNTLGDLTKREYRFAHPFHAIELDRNRTRPASGHPNPFPYDIRRWGNLGLPTLCETSANPWWACFTFPTTANLVSPGQRLPAAIPRRSTVDLWRGPDGIVTDRNVTLAQAVANANQYRVSNPWHQNYWDAYSQPRCMDDVMLTNVIGFDVKAWDPGAPLYRRTVRTATGTRNVAVAPGDLGFVAAGSAAGYGAYVDLGYFPACSKPRGVPRPRFHVVNYDVPNGPRSGLQRTYDTWSTHYEYDGVPQWGARTDWATDGLDNDRRNGVDDAGERETQPPYPFALRSLEVTIRVFEPDSRQVRETTVVQNFLPR